jgi:hypothetical protein
MDLMRREDEEHFARSVFEAGQRAERELFRKGLPDAARAISAIARVSAAQALQRPGWGQIALRLSQPAFKRRGRH